MTAELRRAAFKRAARQVGLVSLSHTGILEMGAEGRWVFISPELTCHTCPLPGVPRRIGRNC